MHADPPHAERAARSCVRRSALIATYQTQLDANTELRHAPQVAGTTSVVNNGPKQKKQ